MSGYPLRAPVLKQPLTGSGQRYRWPARHTLITGGAGRLGSAMAERALLAGGRVSVCDVDEAALHRLADRTSAFRPALATARVDVRDAGAMRSWMSRCDAEAPLDCLVVNAGMSPGVVPGRLAEAFPDARAAVEVNVIGALATVYPAIELMGPRRAGRIVFVASLASYVGFPRVPVYAATKAAVRILGQSLSSGLEERGLKVTVVSPGFFESGMTGRPHQARPHAMTAQAVALRIERALATGRTVATCPTVMRGMIGVLSCLPIGMRNLFYRKWLGR
jgi:NAD(P)-dependent dehydrogenase (short-subunit alcohol dehydrogenase family)